MNHQLMYQHIIENANKWKCETYNELNENHKNYILYS